jgi:transcriptional regulator with XRE-family HTH domain
MHNRIAYFRRQKKITQQELANLTGIHRVQLARYETLNIMPRTEIGIAIARALDTTAEELFATEGSNHDANC